jgi:hypothetical protein
MPMSVLRTESVHEAGMSIFYLHALYAVSITVTLS